MDIFDSRIWQCWYHLDVCNDDGEEDDEEEEKEGVEEEEEEEKEEEDGVRYLRSF